MNIGTCMSLRLVAVIKCSFQNDKCSFQNDIISCARQVELLEADLAARMEQIQATVQSKTAVPTAQVYVSTSPPTALVYPTLFANIVNRRIPEMAVFNVVAGYLIEERRRWPVKPCKTCCSAVRSESHVMCVFIRAGP